MAKITVGLTISLLLFIIVLSKKSFNIMSYVNQPTTNVDGLNCEQVWLEYLKNEKLDKKIYRFDRVFFNC